MTQGHWPVVMSRPALALALVALWLVLACLLPLLAGRRQRRAIRALVLAGVPALGWLTLLWGPGIGVAGLGLGLLILLGHPATRRRRPAPTAKGAAGSLSVGNGPEEGA